MLLGDDAWYPNPDLMIINSFSLEKISPKAFYEPVGD